MSAHHIYCDASLGSLIRYFDGTPKPPARFSKKLAAWERRNGTGRLVKKDPPRDYGSCAAPASITLHEGNFSSAGVITVVVMRTHSVESNLQFEIVERPAAGMVRILQQHGDSPELLYLAADRAAADLWLGRNRYSNVQCEEVAVDGAGGGVGDPRGNGSVAGGATRSP